MARRIRPALGTILENIRGIQQAIEGRSLEEYAADWTIRHAVERGIEIISEASKRIPANSARRGRKSTGRASLVSATCCGTSTTP
jgi:uncharacterized protein with HEPN domain